MAEIQGGFTKAMTLADRTRPANGVLNRVVLRAEMVAIAMPSTSAQPLNTMEFFIASRGPSPRKTER